MNLLAYPVPEIALTASFLLIGYVILRFLLARSAAREDDRSDERAAFWGRFDEINGPAIKAAWDWRGAGPMGSPGYHAGQERYDRAAAERDRKMIEWRREGRRKGYLT